MPSLGPYPGGINNLAQAGRLPTSERGRPLYARNANNLVFNEQGSAFSIFGPEQVISGERHRDGFSCPAGAFFRDGSTIKEFYKDDQGVEAVREICTGVVGNRIAWTHFNGTVYFTDGRVNKKIIGGSCEQWGTPIPSKPPVLSGTSVLGSGQVMACYSYLLDNGMESGCSPVAISSRGKVVSGIRKSTDSRVAAIRIYMTHPDNKTFFLAATILPSEQSATITSDYTNNMQPQTKGKIPPPAGSLLCEHSGRIYIASGGVVYFSDPHAHDLFSLGDEIAGNPEWAAWQFEGQVTMLKAVTGGIYVGCQSGTYFIAGGEPYNPRRVLVDSSIPELGAVRTVGDSGEIIWKSSAAYILGSVNGQARRMNDDNVSMDTSTEGTAMGVMEHNGTKVVIGVPLRPTPGTLRSKDWVPNLINSGCES